MTFSGSFSDHFIILFGLCPAGLYLPCNTWPKPDWTLLQLRFCKPEECRMVIAMSYRWCSCLYIPDYVYGNAEARHSSLMCVTWVEWLIADTLFLLLPWLLLAHKKAIFWPHSKISAEALKSLRCPSTVILRTAINKRQEETFTRLLLLTSTAGWEVGKTPFSNIFTSIGIILAAFFSPSNSCLGPMIEKPHVI